MIDKVYYIETETDCIVCGKSYVPLTDHKRITDKIPAYYVNNYCSAECVEVMDEVAESIKD